MHNHLACPFVVRECLQEGCLAWRDDSCCLIPPTSGIQSAFEKKLQAAAPLMYRSLLDLVKVMENASRDCPKCGPELWNFAQEIRASLLDELIAAELAGVGIRANDMER